MVVQWRWFVGLRTIVYFFKEKVMKVVKLAVLAMGLSAGVAFAGTCDELAASPYDTAKPAEVAGVEYTALDAPAAIAVCESEYAKDPENARLAYQLGRAYHKDRQHDKAVPLFTKASEAEYPIAQFSLAMAYYHGEGVGKDKKRAVALADKACENGFTDACK